MAESSLGRAVALSGLTPIAQRLADERAQREAEEDRRRRLEEALAAVPPLPRPSGPPPDSYLSLGDHFGSMLGWTCGLFIPMFWLVNAVPALIHHHETVGYANPMLALLFSGMLGVLLGGRRYWWGLYRLDQARRDYTQRLRVAEDREIEREMIVASFEEA